MARTEDFDIKVNIDVKHLAGQVKEAMEEGTLNLAHRLREAHDILVPEDMRIDAQISYAYQSGFEAGRDAVTVDD
jgi:hypothetical protein